MKRELSSKAAHYADQTRAYARALLAATDLPLPVVYLLFLGSKSATDIRLIEQQGEVSVSDH